MPKSLVSPLKRAINDFSYLVYPNSLNDIKSVIRGFSGKLKGAGKLLAPLLFFCGVFL